MRTRLLTAVLASALLISPSFAKDNSPSTLAPGKPAGVREADLSTPTLIGLGFIAVIGLGIGLIVSNEGAQTSSTASTTP